MKTSGIHRVHSSGLCVQGSDEDTSDSESEEESRTSESSSGNTSREKNEAALSSPALLQKMCVFVSGLTLLVSSVMNTAGRVLVTVLLGLTGITPARVNGFDRDLMTTCVSDRCGVALADVGAVFRGVRVSGVVLGSGFQYSSAVLQFSLCDDDHLQRRTHSHPLSLPAASHPGHCSSSRRLRQVSYAHKTSGHKSHSCLKE